MSFTIALFVVLTSMLFGLLRLKVSLLQHTKAVPSFVPTPSTLNERMGENKGHFSSESNGRDLHH